MPTIDQSTSVTVASHNKGITTAEKPGSLKRPMLPHKHIIVVMVMVMVTSALKMETVHFSEMLPFTS
jgi:hypothetical protein